MLKKIETVILYHFNAQFVSNMTFSSDTLAVLMKSQNQTGW